jgi:hypothetical protein
MSEGTQEPRRIRAGDADRDRVVAALQTHREAGRLTAEEFEERMESALMARWLDELPPLLSDLPGEQQHREPRTGNGPAPEHGPQPGWRPPWGEPAPAGGPVRGYGPCGHPPGFLRFLLVLAPFFVVAALVGSVFAVAHGHFPFPLLWLAAAAFWFRPWLRWRRYGWAAGQRR